MVTITAPVATAGSPSVVLVRDEVYAVLGLDGMHGYIEKIGDVYVALVGPDLPRACEVGQSLSWDRALSLIERGARR